MNIDELLFFMIIFFLHHFWIQILNIDILLRFKTFRIPCYLKESFVSSTQAIYKKTSISPTQMKTNTTLKYWINWMVIWLMVQHRDWRVLPNQRGHLWSTSQIWLFHIQFWLNKLLNTVYLILKCNNISAEEIIASIDTKNSTPHIIP